MLTILLRVPAGIVALYVGVPSLLLGVLGGLLLLLSLQRFGKRGAIPAEAPKAMLQMRDSTADSSARAHRQLQD